MEKHHRIDWKKGMDITPEILIDSDNYHIAERYYLGLFFASRLYGILPGRKFCIEKDIDNNYLYIKRLECLAISCNGQIMNVRSDTHFNKKLHLEKAASSGLYVVLTGDPYSLTPEYELTLKATGESIENGIPVLKIYQSGQHWEIDDNYIPPSIALYSIDVLKQQYVNIKEKLDYIVEKLPKNSKIYLQITLLKLELDNYSMRESPQELTLLLKKICWTLNWHIKTSKKINRLPNVKDFIDEPYNHNEIWAMVHQGLESLAEIDRQIEKEEEYDIEV